MWSRPQVGQWCEANTTSVRSAKRVDGLGQVARPPVRIPHQCAAQRQQIVQVVGGVLGHTQCAVLRKIEVHLGGGLGARCHLELDLDTVDRVCLTGFADIDRRHDQGDLTRRADLAQPAAHLALRTAVQRSAVHIGGPPRHRGARVDVLLHGVLREVLRRKYCDAARVDIGLRRHAEHAAEMIDVTVGIDNCADCAIPAMGAIQLQRGGCCLGGDQRIDDDDPGVPLDEADVRQVEATHLIDALDHFVETLLGAQLALAPQAGMHRRRRVAADERVGVVVPHHATVGRLDDARALGRREAPVGVVEVRWCRPTADCPAGRGALIRWWRSAASAP